MSSYSPAKIDDFVNLLISNIPLFKREDLWMVAILCAIGNQVQELHDEIDSGFYGIQLPNAEGVWLDYWGTKLGLSRNAQTDGQYRRFLMARIQVLLSNGEIWRIMLILRMMTGALSTSYVGTPPRGYIVQYRARIPVADSDKPEIYRQMLEATAAAYRIDGIIEAPEKYFGWYGDPNATPYDDAPYSEIY